MHLYFFKKFEKKCILHEKVSSKSPKFGHGFIFPMAVPVVSLYILIIYNNFAGKF